MWRWVRRACGGGLSASHACTTTFAAWCVRSGLGHGKVCSVAVVGGLSSSCSPCPPPACGRPGQVHTEHPSSPQLVLVVALSACPEPSSTPPGCAAAPVQAGCWPPPPGLSLRAAGPGTGSPAPLCRPWSWSRSHPSTFPVGPSGGYRGPLRGEPSAWTVQAVSSPPLPSPPLPSPPRADSLTCRLRLCQTPGRRVGHITVQGVPECTPLIRAPRTQVSDVFPQPGARGLGPSGCSPGPCTQPCLPAADRTVLCLGRTRPFC